MSSWHNIAAPAGSDQRGTDIKFLQTKYIKLCLIGLYAYTINLNNTTFSIICTNASNNSSHTDHVPKLNFYSSKETKIEKWNGEYDNKPIQEQINLFHNRIKQGAVVKLSISIVIKLDTIHQLKISRTFFPVPILIWNCSLESVKTKHIQYNNNCRKVEWN